jgi:hypothetical protein
MHTKQPKRLPRRAARSASKEHGRVIKLYHPRCSRRMNRELTSRRRSKTEGNEHGGLPLQGAGWSRHLLVDWQFGQSQCERPGPCQEGDVGGSGRGRGGVMRSGDVGFRVPQCRIAHWGAHPKRDDVRCGEPKARQPSPMFQHRGKARAPKARGLFRRDPGARGHRAVAPCAVRTSAISL